MAFLRIDRAIENHWIYQDAEYFKVWFEILIRSRFSKETEKRMVEGELIDINYAQFIYGRIKWSERLGVSERRLRTLFDRLIKEGMIQLVSKHRKCTVYFVVNFEKYNSKNDQQSDQQQDQSGRGISDTGDQQSDLKATSERPADDQLTTTQEELKKVKKVKKVKEEVIKTLYATNILLTEDEYKKLCFEYTEPFAKACIEYLASYKIEKGYETKSDYLTLRRWVKDAVKKTFKEVKHGEAFQQGNSTGTTEQPKGKVYPSKYESEAALVQ